MASRLISYDDLGPKKGLNFSKVTLWRMEKAKRFPKRVRIGASRYGWLEDEIDQYIELLVAARDASEAA